MVEPKRGWLTRDIDLSGRQLHEDDEVWVHGTGSGWVEIEWRGRRVRVPADAVAEAPARWPSLEELRRLDPCFGLTPEAFVQGYVDQEQLFSVRRCRAHGRRFLSVVGPRWATIETILAEDDPADPQEAFREYYPRTDNWLRRRGRTSLH